MTEVRACPFCGHDDLVHDETQHAAYLECNFCGATGPRIANTTNLYREKVEAEWNIRRKPIDPLAVQKKGQP